MQTDQRTAEVDFRIRSDVSDLLRLIGQYQRFKAAPRVGHAEQAEVVEILCQLSVVETLVEHKREQPAAAGKIAFPELMAFTAGQGGVVDPHHLRMLRQPLGDAQAAFVMLTQADAQRAQAAAGHIGGIGVQHLPHQIGILTQLRPAARVRHRGADHGVGVADQVFGACLDGNINAKIQRFEQDPRRPGVIDHDNRFRRDLTHGGDNRWHIMHFHGDGSGRFQEHHAGLRPNKLGNISAD